MVKDTANIAIHTAKYVIIIGVQSHKIVKKF